MKRHKFNLSHYKLGTCDMGRIYPISAYEVLPGDTVQQGTSVFLRMMPMLAPVMHPVRVGIYTFFCPTRLLWDNFENFITGGPDGLDVTEPPMYHFVSGIAKGSLYDYMGVPVGYTGPFSALPVRAYCRIWNEYFRDQDLIPQSATGLETSDGDSAREVMLEPFFVSWEKDYFTTARPWPQKGAEVSVPVEGLGSGTVTITGTNGAIPFTVRNTTTGATSTGGVRFKGVGDGGSTATQVTGPEFQNSLVDTSAADTGVFSNSLNGTQYAYLNWSDNTRLQGRIAGLSNNANVRLDALREAFALQRFEEHRAMYGSRYTEYLRYLGVKSSDARLQRPEYLGGGKSTLQFSEIMQTAQDGDNPVGTLRGHGMGLVRTKAFRRFFEEHGIVLTLMTIRPIAIYEQGLNKMWSRNVKEDYWQRELEHIGQQEVMTRELYADAAADKVFGYQNRYDEYRSIPSTVCGEMHDYYDYWHMARRFANEPVLNESFVSGTPTKRIFAEQTQNEILFMAQHNVVSRRIMSKQGNPIL